MNIPYLMVVVEKTAIQHREQVQASTSTVLLCLFEINICINSEQNSAAK